MDETWADVGHNSAWLGGMGESWERGRTSSMAFCLLLICWTTPSLKAKVQKFIDWTLDHQASSGMIGPTSNDDWWPRIVMLKVLTQYEERTHDPRVIPVMERYFHYQLAGSYLNARCAIGAGFAGRMSYSV